MTVFLRIIATVLSGATLAMVTGVTVHAEPNDNSNWSTVAMTNGPTVSQGTAGFDSTGTNATSGSATGVAPTSQSSVGTAASDSASELTYRQIPYNQVPGPLQVSSGGLILNNPLNTQAACPSGQTGYFIYDPTGALVRTVCVPNQAPAPPQAATTSPLQLAEEASARQPWPVLRVSTNPDVGLTGLASWFWCAGSASMPDATASAGPLTVTVRATLAGVDWNFGDGSRSAGGLGQPYPAQSDVQHVFQTSTFAMAAGYTVTATVHWTVTFSVNGGPFTVLGVKSRSYSRAYVVNQLQPQAVGVT